MDIKTCISFLRSQDQNQISEALDFLYDQFEYGEPISDDDYLLLIRELTDQVDTQQTRASEADLLATLNSSLYTNTPGGIVSPPAFREAINYIAQTKNSTFKEILEPLASSPNFREVLGPYFQSVS